MDQHPPNPNLSINPYAQFNNAQSSSYSHFSYYPPQNPNVPDPQTSLEHYGVPSAHLDSSLQPAGVDSYAALNVLQPLAGYEAHAAALYQQQIQNWAAATFYQDPNAASIKPPNGTESLVPANLNPAQWSNPVARPYINAAIRKGLKKIKKTKIVQSAYCEVCRIDCNSRDVLDKHKSGKKHQKNLEKIAEARQNANRPASVPAPSAPAAAPPDVAKLQIGPREKPFMKKSVAPKVDLDTKRRKLMEGGAAAEAVRICTICNVACNSQTVFNFHLGGQKHASMVQKRAAART